MMCRVPLLAALCIVALLPGCLGIGPVDRSTTSPTETAQAYSEPPETLTNQTATDVVLKSEEAYVYNELREAGYASWSVGEWRSPSATVLERTPSSVRVRVEMPFSYRHDGGTADRATVATYTVTTESVQRNNGTALSFP